MTESIQKFDITDAAEKLKGQIRSAFIELLTPEQFKDMVQTELKRFTQTQMVPGRYHGDKPVVGPSEFSNLCSEVFREHIKSELKALLASPEYQAGWGNDNRQIVSEAIQSWLTANSRALIETTVLTFAGAAAQQMMASLRVQL